MDEALDALTQARESLRAQNFDTAERLLRRAIERDPTLSLAYELLGKLLYRDSRSEEAAALYSSWLRALPSDPIAGHMAAATGVCATPARASDGFVTGLFDRAAVDFDSTLGALGYQAPQLLFETAGAALGPYAVAFDMLDLGCGTGMCGEWFRPLARYLAGVDLSPEMLERAKQKNCYDDLFCEELTGYLARCERRFDVVTACDVFCYVGELTPVFAAIARVMKPQGWFLFSVELLEEVGAPFKLEEHGRYAHASAYVLSALKAAGLRAANRAMARLRYERGIPVMGLTVAAQRVATD